MTTVGWQQGVERRSVWMRLRLSSRARVQKNRGDQIWGSILSSQEYGRVERVEPGDSKMGGITDVVKQRCQFEA